MRRARKLLTTEGLFVELHARGHAVPSKLIARINKQPLKLARQLPGKSHELEACLYLGYESSVFSESQLGSAEVLALSFPNLPMPKAMRMLDEALFVERSKAAEGEDLLPLSRDLLERAEMRAFTLLLRADPACARINDQVLAIAKQAGLFDMEIPTPTVGASARSVEAHLNSLTGFELQDLERLIQAASITHEHTDITAESPQP